MTEQLIKDAIELAREPSPTLASETIEKLFASPGRVPSMSQREKRSFFALQMYRGDQLAFLRANSFESAEDFSRRQGKTAVNFTRLVIDVLGMLYKENVSRRFTANGKMRERLEEVLAGGEFNAFMSQVDRLSRLLGTIAIRPFYEDGSVTHWIYPPHRFRAIADDANPMKAKAVVIHWTNDRGRATQIWTADKYVSLENGKVAEELDHEYGCVPFVFARDKFDIESFYSAGRGFNVAYHNLLINERLSDLAYTIKMQGFGVLEVKNPDPSAPLSLGPGSAISFQVGPGDVAGIDFKHPGAPIEGLIRDIEFLIRQLLVSERIPESALSVSATSNSSGVAIVAAGSPVIEDRRERIPILRAVENDIACMTARVIAAHEDGFPEDADVSALVNYPEPEIAWSIEDRIRRDEFLLRNELISPWEILYRDNPDGYSSIQDAKESYLARRREMRDLGSRMEDGGSSGNFADGGVRGPGK
ncbi:MAG: hypothetical protein NUW37_20255 [Planctomycetes bacterium]|nr:hypothetical protein [Planctomycetota bacterium]